MSTATITDSVLRRNFVSVILTREVQIFYCMLHQIWGSP